MSYGHREGVDHPDVQDAVKRVEGVVRGSRVHLGGLALDAETANAMIARGYRVLIGGFDTALVQRSAAELLDGIGRG